MEEATFPLKLDVLDTLSAYFALKSPKVNPRSLHADPTTSVDILPALTLTHLHGGMLSASEPPMQTCNSDVCKPTMDESFLPLRYRHNSMASCPINSHSSGGSECHGH